MKEFAIGALLAVMLTLASGPVMLWIDPPDPDDWLYVESINVPNFSLQNYREVKLEYIREVRVPFDGRYHVKAVRILEDGSTANLEDPPAVCLGTDDFPYTIHPHTDMSMHIWKFIGPLRPGDAETCFSEPGLYRFYIQWEMIHDKGERRVQRKTSNIFRVTE